MFAPRQAGQELTVVVAAASYAAEELARRLRALGGDVVFAGVTREGLVEALETSAASLLLLDAASLGDDLEPLLREARALWPDLTIDLLASEAPRPRLLSALSAGANDWLERSSDDALRLSLDKARARLARREGNPVPPALGGRLLLGRSPAIRAVHALIERVAPTVATVLVLGESGTGKELVARALHDQGADAERAFVKIDCTSLPENLLESELFGYEKGAFTGASARKLGRVELAQGGTLFLDEVGELGLATQAKLLRLLQDREFERLGGTKTLKVDLRVIAATHRDLETMVHQGKFRQDLFYRLNVVPIWLPPLRARRRDVAELARHFCQDAAARNRRPARLDDGAIAELSRQRWPGNVRQLQNFVERLVVLSAQGDIGAEGVRAELERPMRFSTEALSSDEWAEESVRRAPASRSSSAVDTDAERADTQVSPDAARATTAEASDDTPERLSQVVRDAERQALVHALDTCSGRRSDAARVLGVSRSTFYAKMKQHGLL